MLAVQVPIIIFISRIPPATMITKLCALVMEFVHVHLVDMNVKYFLNSCQDHPIYLTHPNPVLNETKLRTKYQSLDLTFLNTKYNFFFFYFFHFTGRISETIALLIRVFILGDLKLKHLMFGKF